MKRYRPYNLESTGALIESAHPSPTRMDVLCSRQRGCKCIFFFPFSDSAQFRPIQSDSIRNRPWIGPIQTEISVKEKKKNPKIYLKLSLTLVLSVSPLSLSLSLSLWLSWTLIFYLVLVSNFRSCILISEHHGMVMYSVFTLLSTITLKLVYVYHYMKKYA